MDQLALILAFPVGSFLFLICYFIHAQLFEHCLSGPITTVRYLYLSKILVEHRPKSSCISLKIPSTSALTDALTATVNLKAGLEYAKTQIQEDAELAGQLHHQISQQQTLHETLSSQLRKVTAAIRNEEAYITAVEARLKILQEFRSNASSTAVTQESVNSEHFISDTVIPDPEPPVGQTIHPSDNDLRLLAQDMQNLVDHHLHAIMERILRESERNKEVVGEVSERCVMLADNCVTLQKLRDEKSQLEFQTAVLEDVADVCRSESDPGLKSLHTQKKTVLRRITSFFSRKKTYDVAAVQSSVALSSSEEL